MHRRRWRSPIEPKANVERYDTRCGRLREVHHAQLILPAAAIVIMLRKPLNDAPHAQAVGELTSRDPRGGGGAFF